MASNAIARKNDGAWSEVTMLANKDATVEIVGVVRDVIEIAHIESVRSPERCWDHRSDATGHAESKFS
jgi:hypothetical protein